MEGRVSDFIPNSVSLNDASPSISAANTPQLKKKTRSLMLEDVTDGTEKNANEDNSNS